MKIQGSYTPPMGQSAYSNLKQNISTSAMQNGPEHTAQTMQKLAKPDQATLDAHELIRDMRHRVYAEVQAETKRSATDHLVKAYLGLEAFKEQQMAINPSLDLSDLDIALKDGNIIVTGIRSQNGEPVTGNQINAIQEALSDNEELTKNLEYALSDLTKAVQRDSKIALTTDIEKLDSLEHNKEDLVENAAFTLNSFIEGFLEEYPALSTPEEIRDARKARRMEMLGHTPIETTRKEKDFGHSIKSDYFNSSLGHYLTHLGMLAFNNTNNQLVNTKA